MFGKKLSLTTAILVLCFGFFVAPADAAPRRAEVPRASIEVPVATLGDSPVGADRRVDFSQLRFEMEGASYSAQDLKRLGSQVSVIVDEESLRTGVARAYRTREEFDNYAEASCSNVTAESNTAQCIFYNSLSCSGWTARVIINCGYAVTNIHNLLTVRSFRLGCGRTFICGGGDCTSCSFYSGAAGTCFNVTSGTVRCAGCAH